MQSYMIRRGAHSASLVGCLSSVFLLASPGLKTCAGQAQQNSLYRNGITVSRPKLYDNRSLTLMLRTLEDTLASTNFLNAGNVAGAIDRFQGSTAKSTSTSFNIMTSPTPEIITTVTNKGGETPTTDTEKKITSQSVTPTVPATASPATPSVAQTTGISAQDILAEQMALTYQIFNLRLLMERSLTDRLYSLKLQESGTSYLLGNKGQAVVGFQISIDPQKAFKNAVAEVEIQITPDISKAKKIQTKTGSLFGSENEPPTIVAMLPMSKTYNVATVTNKSSAFGLGAVASIFNVGFGNSQSNQTLYLVRDTDTVALELPALSNDVKTLRFAWQFRPVLGRAAVEPGMRQVFAAMSLPSLDTSDYVANVKIITRWRKYDAGRRIVGDLIGQDQVAPSDQEITVYNQAFLEEQLRPKITRVDIKDAGGGQVLVTVDGESFLPGTSVLLGNKTLGQDNAFTIQNDRRILFLAPITELLTTVPKVVGRYGGAKEIKDPAADDGSASMIPIDSVSTTTADALNTQVTVKLKAETPLTHPLVRFGSRVYGLSDAALTITGGLSKVKEISFLAPTSMVRDARSIVVIDPFKGQAYVSEYTLQPQQDFSAKKATTLAENSETVLIAVQGSNFTRMGVSVNVGGDDYGYSNTKEFTFVDSTLIRLLLPRQKLRGVKQITVSRTSTPLPTGSTPTNTDPRIEAPVSVLLSLDEPTPVSEPKIVKVDDIIEGASKNVKFEGTDFASIDKALFEKTELTVKKENDGKTMTIAISGLVTQQPGERQITFILTDGKEFPYILNVKPKPSKP
ncbi:MAG: hypothetical protein JWL77_4180 [Chthonomonadaceae bacterium]|nr:hypothetical protein [Chthonomonadaceae bacterium]